MGINRLDCDAKGSND